MALVAAIGVLALTGSAQAQVPEQVQKALRAARAPLPQLEAVSVRESFGARFYRFRQMAGGVPVLGAEAVFTDGSARGADLLVDSTKAGIERPPSAKLPATAALSAARAVTSLGAPHGAPIVEAAILPDKGGGRFVWRVVISSYAPPSEREILIDALSGAVVRERELLRFANGTGAVFDPNPVETQGSFANLSDDFNDADTATLTAQRQTRVLRGLSPQGPNLCLTGPYVRSFVTNNPGFPNSGERILCAPSGDFTPFTRSNPVFEGVMSYFFIDSAQRYLRSLGFSGQNAILNRAITVHNDKVPEDNSFYDTAQRDLTFGIGGVDDAEDGEVILHEYGHAIQDDQVRGFGNSKEGGAMGEGFGDYFASSFTARASSPRPNRGFDACWAPWDNVEIGFPAGQRCERRVDSKRTVPQLRRACGGTQIHCVGVAWSGALWAIRSRLGPTATDRLILQSHFSLTQGSGFYDGSQALLKADRQLNRGRNVGFLSKLLGQRDLLREPDGAPRLAEPLGRRGTVYDYAENIGRRADLTDTDDVYRVRLGSGQRVRLTLVGAGGGNLDLYLYRPGTKSVATTRGVVARNIGRGSREALTFRAPRGRGGVYFVDVFARGGGSTYKLTARP